MKETVLNIIENAVNTCVRLSPQAENSLVQLENKRVRMVLTDLNLSYDILFGAHSVQCLSISGEAYDVMLRGTAVTFFRLSVSDKRQQLKLAQDLEIQGDVELGQKSHEFFKNIDIDWEEHLSKIVGDVAAHQIGNFARGMKSFLSKANQHLEQDLNDYLHQETRWVPAPEEVSSFYESVDALRNDVERLEAKTLQ